MVRALFLAAGNDGGSGPGTPKGRSFRPEVSPVASTESGTPRARKAEHGGPRPPSGTACRARSETGGVFFLFRGAGEGPAGNPLEDNRGRDRVGRFSLAHRPRARVGEVHGGQGQTRGPRDSRHGD